MKTTGELFFNAIIAIGLVLLVVVSVVLIFDQSPRPTTEEKVRPQGYPLTITDSAGTVHYAKGFEPDTTQRCIRFEDSDRKRIITCGAFTIEGAGTGAEGAI